MVFDFFKKRAEEGVEQLSNLSNKVLEGKIVEGFSDAASYTSETNAAFADGLAKSRNRLLYSLESWGGDVLEELEDVLLQADLGMKTTEDVIAEVKSLREDSTQIFSKDDVRSILRGKLLEALSTSTSTTSAIQFSRDESIPTVLFVMGANGMGKTTTIGKLAARLKNEGSQKVLLAACDTFRAGAVEQLEMWANRADVSFFSVSDTKNPSTVLYGALGKALEEKYDTLIVDTSGRLSNNYELTEELVKMKSVIQKRLSKETDEENRPVPNLSTPHEVLLVIDAAQGRVATDSARAWDEAIKLTGLVLTKLDGSAKGGSVVAVSRELGLPVKLVGVGEKIEDLRDFEAEVFVDGLLGIGSAGGKTSFANEGKDLERRLKQLREARDNRALKINKTVNVKDVGGGNIMDGMNFEPIESPVALENKISPNPKPKKKKRKKKKKRGNR